MNNKNILIICLLAILLIGGTLVYTTTTNKNIRNEENKEPLIGGQTDEHGCLVAAGYSWCQAKNKCLRIFEEFCPDAAASLVDSIKTETGVTLSPAGNTEFNWIVAEADVTTDNTISGVLYSSEGVHMADYNKIEKYMNDNFEADNYNLADGVVGGLRGYYGNYMACLLNFRHSQMKEVGEGIMEPVGDNLKVTLECGYFNKNKIHTLIVGQLIGEALAKKYQKAIGETSITITKQDDTHAAGNVVFGQGGPGEGGGFLAVKINNLWKVVFDGNGSVDCNKMRQEYGFSDEILKPEFCD